LCIRFLLIRFGWSEMKKLYVLNVLVLLFLRRSISKKKMSIVFIVLSVEPFMIGGFMMIQFNFPYPDMQDFDILSMFDLAPIGAIIVMLMMMFLIWKIYRKVRVFYVVLFFFLVNLVVFFVVLPIAVPLSPLFQVLFLLFSIVILIIRFAECVKKPKNHK